MKDSNLQSPPCPAPDEASAPASSFLCRTEIWAAHLLRAMMFFCCISLALLMFIQVILRYVLDSPFVGIEEMSILLAVWIYFLGMGYATKTQEHIHGGILSLVVSDPLILNATRLFGGVLCMLGACVFGYFALQYALKEIDRGRASIVMQWPRWIWSSSMMAGFAMMIVYFALNSYRQWLHVLHIHRQAKG
ncbi:MAG: TRAP transporter small permease [Pseudomonadales bacterium]